MMNTLEGDAFVDEQPRDFVTAVHQMLTREDPSIIEWSRGQILVKDPRRLEHEVLGRYFRHSKLASFQRQLNYHGFEKTRGLGSGRGNPCAYHAADAPRTADGALAHDTRSVESVLLARRKRTRSLSDGEEGARGARRRRPDDVPRAWAAFAGAAGAPRALPPPPPPRPAPSPHAAHVRIEQTGPAPTACAPPVLPTRTMPFGSENRSADGERRACGSEIFGIDERMMQTFERQLGLQTTTVDGRLGNPCVPREYLPRSLKLQPPPAWGPAAAGAPGGGCTT